MQWSNLSVGYGKGGYAQVLQTGRYNYKQCYTTVDYYTMSIGIAYAVNDALSISYNVEEIFKTLKTLHAMLQL